MTMIPITASVEAPTPPLAPNASRQAYDADIDGIIALASKILSEGAKAGATSAALPLPAGSVQDKVFNLVEQHRAQTLVKIALKLDTDQRQALLSLCQRYLEATAPQEQEALLQQMSSIAEECGIDLQPLATTLFDPYATIHAIAQLDDADKSVVQKLINGIALEDELKLIKQQEQRRLQFIYANTMGGPRSLMGGRLKKSDYDEQRYQIDLRHMEQTHPLEQLLLQHTYALILQNITQPEGWSTAVKQLEDAISNLQRDRERLQREKDEQLQAVALQEKAAAQRQRDDARQEAVRQAAQLRQQDTAPQSPVAEELPAGYWLDAITSGLPKHDSAKGKEKRKGHCALS